MSKLQFIQTLCLNVNLSKNSIKYIINLLFNALNAQFHAPIFTIEEPEHPKTLYKIFCHGTLIVAAGAIVNGDNITYQLIANKQTKKMYITFDDLLDNFYDAICNFIKSNKINIRDKKIQIDQITLINTIIENTQRENTQRENTQRENTQRENTQSIYSSPLFSTGDEICDAYNEGAKDMRNTIIEQLFKSANLDSANLDSANLDSANSNIINFLENFFNCRQHT
jgi:hypothetical protein